VIGAQTLERGMYGLANARGAAIGSSDFAVFDLKSEFGGDGDLSAP